MVGWGPTRGGVVVQVRLFGGVGATTDAGDPVDIGPAKCQLVLAALALEPGVAVPVPRLVELVWGDDAPRTAERTLQSYVARIRRGLGTESIVRAGAAYRLDLDPGQVDVARFEAHVGNGETAAALAEWTGAPLAGLEAPGLRPAVDRLYEVWLAATEADLGSRLERDPASVIGPLTELSATHPYREGLWALLMTALYRTGRQADALAAYRRARAILVDELGVEPGPRLRELEGLVLDQHEDLDGRPASTPARAARPGARRGGRRAAAPARYRGRRPGAPAGRRGPCPRREPARDVDRAGRRGQDDAGHRGGPRPGRVRAGGALRGSVGGDQERRRSPCRGRCGRGFTHRSRRAGGRGRRRRRARSGARGPRQRRAGRRRHGHPRDRGAGPLPGGRGVADQPGAAGAGRRAGRGRRAPRHRRGSHALPRPRLGGCQRRRRRGPTRASPRCANGSTGSRSPSSSPPPGPAR